MISVFIFRKQVMLLGLAGEIISFITSVGVETSALTASFWLTSVEVVLEVVAVGGTPLTKLLLCRYEELFKIFVMSSLLLSSKAVWPLLLQASVGSAPNLTKTFTILGSPRVTASWRAVIPLALVRLGSAPNCSKRICTVTALPNEAAQCRGVFWLAGVSMTETSMPARKSRSIWSRLKRFFFFEELYFENSAFLQVMDSRIRKVHLCSRRHLSDFYYVKETKFSSSFWWYKVTKWRRRRKIKFYLLSTGCRLH